MSQTRVSQAIAFIGDDTDDIALDVRDGQLIIGLGSALALDLGDADQDTLDKLAVVAAEAATVKRNRSLWVA